jgi:hypothetical protein
MIGISTPESRRLSEITDPSPCQARTFSVSHTQSVLIGRRENSFRFASSDYVAEPSERTRPYEELGIELARGQLIGRL